MAKLLLYQSDCARLDELRRVFAQQGHEIISCGRAESADQILDLAFNVAVLEHAPPHCDGLAAVSAAKKARAKTPIILTFWQGGSEATIEAIKRGAFDCFSGPLDVGELTQAVAEAVRVAERLGALAKGAGAPILPTAGSTDSKMVGSHRRMQAVFKRIGQVADQDVTVLITGESGTGKELVARAIHQHSHRAGGPFTAVNCASIPDTLFESELFGYEPGAFTGAERRYAGRFERSIGGTLFFDEIGDMSLATQAKVLRALQEGQIERLGGSEPIQVNVRILAATNKDLAKEVDAGRFRQDLYFRLKVVSIELPPLRDRPEDLAGLAHYFAGRFAAEYGRPVRFVADAAIAKLQSHHWPGNVRELENCLRRAVLFCKGETLLANDIEFGERGSPIRPQDDYRAQIDRMVLALLRQGDAAPRDNLVDMVEERLIRAALSECENNQVHAARRLGISRNTLRGRMKKFGLGAPPL